MRRPSDEWHRQVAEEAAEVAKGSRSPDDVNAAVVWPEPLRSGTDTILAAFEEHLRTLASPSDEDVLRAVRQVVLALNEVNDRQSRTGSFGYETGEREELCEYIDASLEESGIDVRALEDRHGIDRGEIAGNWRRW